MEDFLDRLGLQGPVRWKVPDQTDAERREIGLTVYLNERIQCSPRSFTIDGSAVDPPSLTV